MSVILCKEHYTATRRIGMARINRQWGDCITRLLEKHNLTARGAMLKSGGVVSHTTITDWCRGMMPQQIRDKVWPFLESFPREEAIECLEAADLPIPPEWESGINLINEKMVIDGAEVEVTIALAEGYTELSDESRKAIEDVVREVIKKERAEREQQREEN